MGRLVGMGQRSALIAIVSGSLVLAACTSSKHAAPAASAPVSSGAAASSAASSAAAAVGCIAPASASVAASSAAAGSSSAASAPTASATPSPTAAAFPTAVWPTYHHDVARTGNAGNVAAVKGLKVAATASLDGAVYASPLVLHDAKGDLDHRGD